MDIVNARRKSDDQSIIENHSDMMSRICKKFPGEFRVDGIVKYFCGDVHQNALITALQNLNFDGHVFASARPLYRCAALPISRLPKSESGG
jgi:hypothetical protein